MAGQYELADLLYLMSRLRNPKTGCPWDLAQDFQSLIPYTLEEAYEVADAIEQQDWPHVEEELGDLLLQVIFYGQLGQEQNRFNLASIIHRLVEKLLRRHPHVFPDGTLQSERGEHDIDDPAEAKGRWDAIKLQERAGQATKPLLDDVPAGLPAMQRAVKLQKKASKVGFDWDNAQQVVAKIEEELAELKAELAVGDQQRSEEELGDLLFAITNLARHLKIDPETALRGCNQRFYQRFGFVEKTILAQGGWQNATHDSMEQAYQQAKKQEHK